jgi:hypothetical protein
VKQGSDKLKVKRERLKIHGARRRVEGWNRRGLEVEEQPFSGGLNAQS